MKGDFTRLPSDRAARYRSVRLQQGRVLLDAEWNEQVEIEARVQRTEARDVIGACGVPEDDAGFEVTPRDGELFLSPGRAWVDGILCELPATWVGFAVVGRDAAGGTIQMQPDVLDVDGRRFTVGQWIEFGDLATPLAARITEVTPVAVRAKAAGLSAVPNHGRLRRLTTYDSQAAPPGRSLQDAAQDGIHVAWLDVWERHVTAIQDSSIREVALRGPDTTSRTEVVAQVRLQHLPGADDAISCEQAKEKLPKASDWRLKAMVDEAAEAPGPCEFPPTTGYRRLENQLYRIEVHAVTPAGVTWKWSRENGSVVVPVVDVVLDGSDPQAATVTVETVGRDDLLSIRKLDVVELIDDARELAGSAGILAVVDSITDPATPSSSGARVKEVRLTRAQGVVAVDAASAAAGHWRLRRWDHPLQDPDTSPLAPVVPPAGGSAELEDGVKVEFVAGSAGGVQPGDYWVVPARTVTRDVEWPRTGPDGGPEARLPHGIRHHTCCLAILRRATTGTGGATQVTWSRLRDCRQVFPPLTRTRSGGCCVRVEPGSGDELRRAIETVKAAGGGCICLAVGVHRVRGTLWLRDCHGVVLHGEAPGAVLHVDGVGAFGGAVAVVDSSDLTIERLTIVGVEAAALVDVRAGAVGCRGIRLRELSLLILGGARAAGAALRAAACDDVVLQSCRMLAPIGVLARASDELQAAAPPAEPVVWDLAAAGRERSVLVGARIAHADVSVAGVAFHVRGQVQEHGRATCSPARGMIEFAAINLRFDVGSPVERVRAHFTAVEEPFNLAFAGGEAREVSLAELKSSTGVHVDGVHASIVQQAPQSWVLTLDGGVAQNQLVIGGGHLVLDRLEYVPVAPARQPPAAAALLAGAVRRLQLRDCEVWYAHTGVMAAMAEAWRCVRTSIQPAAGGVFESLRQRLVPALAAGDPAPILRWSETVRAGGPSAGIAFQAGIVVDAVIRDCTLVGDRAVEVVGWWGGALACNRVRAGRSGVLLGWLYGGDLDQNDIGCERGEAVRVLAAIRSRVRRNSIRATVGVSMATWRAMAEAGSELITALAASHDLAGVGEQAVTEAMVPMVLRATGLSALGEALSEALAKTAAAAPANRIPGGATFLRRLQQGVRGTELGTVTDCEISGNVIEATEDAIDVGQAVLLGSLRVVDNQIDAGGYGIRLVAPAWAADGRTLGGLVGAFAQQLSATVTSALRQLADSRLPADAKAAWQEFGAAARPAIQRWTALVEGMVDGELRVQGNGIRSGRTAVSTNLYHAVIADNQVLLTARAIDDAAWAGPVRVLDRVAVLQPLARSLAAGRTDASGVLAEDLIAMESASLATGEVREALRGVASTVGSGLLNDRLRRVVDDLDSGDATRIARGVSAGIREVARARDDAGIRATGASVRVVDNEITAPPAGREESWPAGGIVVGGNVRDEAWLAAIAARRLFGAAVAGTRDAFGVSETLVAGNEVHGGSGHGVEARGGVVGALRVTGNQIRHMLAAGLWVKSGVVSAGADLCDNVIESCGAGREGDESAGIAVAGVVRVRVAGNRVHRCSGAGVHLSDGEDAAIVGNHVESCASGPGIRLATVIGDVRVHENVLRHNGATEFQWINRALGANKVVAVVNSLAGVLGFSRGAEDRGEQDPRRSGQGDVSHNTLIGIGSDVACQIESIDCLTIVGNRFDNPKARAMLHVRGAVSQLSLAHNRFGHAGDRWPAFVSGAYVATVIGNVGYAPIRVVNLRPATAIPKNDLNVPGADLRP